MLMMQGTASLQISFSTGGSVICLYFFSCASITVSFQMGVKMNF